MANGKSKGSSQTVLGTIPQCQIQTYSTMPTNNIPTLLGSAILFAMTEFSPGGDCDQPETTDSFNTGVKTRKSGLAEMTCSITAQLMLDQQPDASLWNIMEGSLINLAIYPYGIGEGLYPYNLNYFMIKSWKMNGRVKGSEPVSVQFDGFTTGAYTTPNGLTGGQFCAINWGRGT